MSTGPAAVARHALRIDVSDAVGLPDAAVAVSLVVPAEIMGPRTLIVALPGGGYSRGYWDITWPGGYSQAEYHAQRGWLFAAVDHLGIGASSPLDPSLLTIDLMARAVAAVAQRMTSRLRLGVVANSLAPVTLTQVIGVGQSMGGCVSIAAQARYRPFDALAVLGYSASHAVLPLPADEVDLIDSALLGRDSAALAWCYHHDDIDPAVRFEDLRGGFPFRTEHVPPWGVATIPPVALSIMTPGVVAGDAATVSVPVFIGVGDRDVCPDPRAEPACYGAAPQVTLAVVEPMAHMHNFASSRRQLWNRLHDWATHTDGRRAGDQASPAATSSHNGGSTHGPATTRNRRGHLSGPLSWLLSR